MMDDPNITNLVCPIEPHEMDKNLRFGMEDIVRRVVCVATMQGVGRDLLLRVYLAGLFHGVELSKRACDSDRSAEGGETALAGSTEGESAGPKDIAQKDKYP